MAANPESDPFASLRHAMVEQQLRVRGIRDERVLAAMERVPRHEFVPTYNSEAAYEDHPIEIGQQQTISQPFMVAAMAEAAQIKPADVVLEVGTGSGYQAAVLAELAAEVFTIERFASLAETAQKLLAHLNYANIVVALGDGSNGLPQYAPYDAIVVAAAAPEVPPALVDQLREGGRLVIPIGSAEEQELFILRKQNGIPATQKLFGCKFVPLIGRFGFHPAT
jgi:protein-L-isoaspartate(D-aspartate) O-methyltransferase